jgi:hypothetical protein
MKEAFAAGAFWVAVAAFAGAPSAVDADAAAQPAGAAYITTLPSGADVWFDGTYVGRAPVYVDAVPPGRHAVTLTMTGWGFREVDLDVAAGDVSMSSTRLVAGPKALAEGARGAVIVRGAPPDAKLAVDGALVVGPSGTPHALPAGTHTIEMTTPRGRTVRAFTVVPETTTELVLHEQRGDAVHSAVIAPAADYLPTDAFSVVGTKVVIRYGGHLVVAHLGDPNVRLDRTALTYDSAPVAIAGKLYLPLDLLEKLSGDTSNGR